MEEVQQFQNVNQRANLHDTIRADCKFLQENSIIDYSLLIGEIEEPIEEVKAIIKDNGGEAVYTEYWGLRDLAYKIKKSERVRL